MKNSTGGFYAWVGGGDLNDAGGNYSAVSGGKSNLAGEPWRSIAGGESNTVGDDGASTFGTAAAILGGRFQELDTACGTIPKGAAINGTSN